MLAGHGNHAAFLSESDAGSPFTNIRRSEVLVDAVLAAHSLHSTLKMEPGHRLAIYLPNDGKAVVWIEAAKRLGTPYVAVAAGTSSISLANRLEDTDAQVLVTHARWASVVTEALAEMPLSESTCAVAISDNSSLDERYGWYDSSELLEAARPQCACLAAQCARWYNQKRTDLACSMVHR